MSLILEALDKAQKKKDNRDKFSLPPVSNENKPAKDLPYPIKPKSYKKSVIFGLILFIALTNLVFLSWWLNRNNAAVSVVIPSVSITPIVKDAATEENIPVENNINIIKYYNEPALKTSPAPAPKLKVTGILWDEKDPIVLVNSKLLKINDEILGTKIIDIQPHEVRFLHNEEEFTISVE